MNTKNTKNDSNTKNHDFPPNAKDEPRAGRASKRQKSSREEERPSMRVGSGAWLASVLFGVNPSFDFDPKEAVTDIAATNHFNKYPKIFFGKHHPINRHARSDITIRNHDGMPFDKKFSVSNGPFKNRPVYIYFDDIADFLSFFRDIHFESVASDDFLRHGNNRSKKDLVAEFGNLARLDNITW